MWCPSCRAEVAAELSTDNRRMLCARCQTVLGTIPASATTSTLMSRIAETERDARELLARWSSQSLLAPPEPLPSPELLPPPKVDAARPKAELRFDGAARTVPIPSAQFLASAVASSNAASPADHAQPPVPENLTEEFNPPPRSRGARLAQAATEPATESPAVTHADPVADDRRSISSETQFESPAFHIPPSIRGIELSSRKPTWMMTAGQICSYTGVCLLTCGTCLVMWNYFGGPANFLPMGWLTAAVGQMFLFLGVVTLIASGMDQTVHEVGWRIDYLAEQIHSMELALEELTEDHHRRREPRPSKSSEDEATSTAA